MSPIFAVSVCDGVVESVERGRFFDLVFFRVMGGPRDCVLVWTDRTLPVPLEGEIVPVKLDFVGISGSGHDGFGVEYRCRFALDAVEYGRRVKLMGYLSGGCR